MTLRLVIALIIMLVIVRILQIIDKYLDKKEHCNCKNTCKKCQKLRFKE